MKTPKHLTKTDVVDLLRLRFKGSSLREIAKEIEVSASYLHDVLHGRRAPGPTILNYLQLEKIEVRTVIYKGKVSA